MVFEIYANKKIIAEELPDYMFIRKPAAGEDENEPLPDEKNGDYIYDGLEFDGSYILEDRGISYADSFDTGIITETGLIDISTDDYIYWERGY